MKCVNCGNDGVETTEMCSNCLANVIEKRAKKALRTSGLFRNAKILAINDGSCEGEVNAHLIKKIITVTEKIDFSKNYPKSEAYDFIAISDTADRQAEIFLEGMLGPNEDTPGGAMIRLLGDSLATEVAAYAKLKGIKCVKRAITSDVAVLAENLEKRHKGAKFGLVKSSKLIQELRQYPQ